MVFISCRVAFPCFPAIDDWNGKRRDNYAISWRMTASQSFLSMIFGTG